MFKRLRNLLGRSSRPAERKPSFTAAAPRTGFNPLQVPTSSPRRVEPAPTPVNPAPELDNEDVSISLQSVLNSLPPELSHRVIPMDLAGATLTVALTKVLSQLPFGAVKLSFGELRRAAPQLFSPGDQSDLEAVELPLNELLVRINPALLPQTTRQPVAAGTDTIGGAFVPAPEFLAGDEIPEFSAPPRTSPARPVNGPIRVPLPGDFAESAPAKETAKPAANHSSDASLSVPLASLTANWPALVRAEIAQLECALAQVILPESLVREGMKQGKVAFSWKLLRGWMKPAPPLVISKYDDATMELPLEVLTPLFMKSWNQIPKTQPKFMVDESIPAIFSAAPPLETPAPLEGNGSDAAVAATDNRTEDSITPEGNFKKRYTSPSEVIARATSLDGVAGALVVLPEGLSVASNLSTQDADALAAFLARAFGKVAQCADDSRVGELSRLEFWANDIHWLVFNLNSVLLATFGQAGGSLPAAELAALAKELDGKRQA